MVLYRIYSCTSRYLESIHLVAQIPKSRLLLKKKKSFYRMNVDIRMRHANIVSHEGMDMLYRLQAYRHTDIKFDASVALWYHKTMV